MDAAEEGATRREPVEVDCADCGQTFEHTKRGAVPKRCPDCRGKTRSAAPAATGETAPRGRGIDKLESNLKVQLGALAMLAALADPWLGEHIARNVETAAKVHANLAATNPKIRASLEKSVELAGWGPVIIFWLTFLVPVLAHYRAPKGKPDTPENVHPIRPSHAA